MEFLFDDLPEELSPRLKWMRKHHIHVEQSKDGTWIAYKEKTKHFHRDTEEKHALAGLASKIKIRLWNE